MTRLEQQMNFIIEIDKLKEIVRQTYISSAERKETDAEHAWHFAIMAVLLAEYANEPVDVMKVVKMALIHDLVEIDAGDTYLYDEEGAKTKADRENKAADRLFHMLPEDQGEEFDSIWREFEERKTPEARFAAALDRLQPVMLNDATNGKAWEEHGITEEQVRSHNEHVKKGSLAIWEYLEKIFDKNIEKGKIQRSSL
ncbi:MAG TPA: HD domain-containing protein [Candidatus Anaerostipes avistercoris]|uniref:HD domain-containing protein n=1 Tax=Candidatus Anaerostipes avistercoris TaxID=2838462 RepID=A0A9D2PLH3_9FIRM|nr:HD domain-containing protein [uncultured Anaerostipes sp.]HJC51063.1 HD domain-containing protein [Candidatus Anaerostipes avistercoris]